MPTTTAKRFTKQRDILIEYIADGMVAQGASRSEAISATTCIYFWDRDDVENLYKCINSDLDDNVKAAIVAHDFNGLSRKEKCFLPKSIQFKEGKHNGLSPILRPAL